MSRWAKKKGLPKQSQNQSISRVL